MKIKELIKKGGMTSSMIEKVRTYNDEVDIPMTQYVKLIDESVMFKKLQGFFNLKDVLDVFDSVELVMMYTTISETTEILLFKCKKGIHSYTLSGTLSVDRISKGKEKAECKKNKAECKGKKDGKTCCKGKNKAECKGKHKEKK